MVVVAVAGGTGNVGRTIVEVLSKSTEYEIIILARETPEESVSVAPVHVTDYSDIRGMNDLMGSQNVHTVISTISVTTEAASAAQVNLIKAAAKSSTVKRFIATGWGALPSEA
jgi:nucleoside-diphosphate-sugar epimerase